MLDLVLVVYRHHVRFDERINIAYSIGLKAKALLAHEIELAAGYHLTGKSFPSTYSDDAAATVKLYALTRLLEKLQQAINEERRANDVACELILPSLELSKRILRYEPLLFYHEAMRVKQACEHVKRLNHAHFRDLFRGRADIQTRTFGNAEEFAVHRIDCNNGNIDGVTTATRNTG